MSDNVTWASDFDMFLAELDTEQNANDTSFMDLLDPTGYYDFGHVDDAALGAADPLDPLVGATHHFSIWPADEIMHLCSPHGSNDLILPSAIASCQTKEEFFGKAYSGWLEQSKTDQRHTCAECKERFLDYGWLEIHGRESGHGVFACTVPGCGQDFWSKDRYDEHRRNHIDGHERIGEERPLACVECSVEFKNKAKLQEHAKEAQHNPFACSCGKNFARLDVLNRHLDCLGTELPKFPCQYCKNHRGKNGFRRRDHLLQHVRGYHKFEAESKIENILPSCRGRYQTPPVCHFAGCSHYRDDSFKNLSREEQNRSKPFESQSEYTKHMKNAHDFTAFPCTVRGCSKTGAKGYAREKDLIKHRKKDHPEAGTYVPATRDVKITCPMCGTSRGPNSVLYHPCYRS